MNLPIKVRNFGIATGIAIFVVVALYVSIAANKPSLDSSTNHTAINASVTLPAEQLGMAFAAVAKHVKPAVVSVYSEKLVKVQLPDFPFLPDELFNRFFEHSQKYSPKQYSIPQRGMGSGMILDQEGHVLTNYHVVRDVDEIKVQLADKRNFKAKIVGSDEKTDVAIIKIVGDVPNDLPIVQLGNSDALEDGHLVIAIGAPFGLTQTVTSGIISAQGRSEVGVVAYEDFLQTDASINPGNSGGPLVNMQGEVIGMNSAIATGGRGLGSEGQSAGVGFAIPSNLIKTLLPTLTKGGKIIRGMLGVSIQDLNEDLVKNFHLPNSNGALVSQVNRNSPADKAGVKSGDVIIKFGDSEVGDSRQLRNLVSATSPGQVVKLVVIRDGKEKVLRATIAQFIAETTEVFKREDNSESQLENLGLSLETLTPDLAEELGLQGESGVLISGVEDGSLASIANLKVGDLIVEADHKRVRGVGELEDVIGKDKQQILLLIKRNSSSMFVVIRLK